MLGASGCILDCLKIGASYVGVSGFDAIDRLEVIEAERYTVLSGVPASFLAMLGRPARADFARSFLLSGTYCDADADVVVLRRRAAACPVSSLVQVCGQAESSTLISCPRVDDSRRRLFGLNLPAGRVRTEWYHRLCPVPGGFREFEHRTEMT